MKSVNTPPPCTAFSCPKLALKSDHSALGKTTLHKHHLKYIYFWTLNIYIVLGWLMLPDSAAVMGVTT